MMLVRRVAVAIWSTLLLTAPLMAQQAPAGQSEFVPVGDLPAAEQLPSAPLLIAAYSFVLVAAIAYVWSVGRRINKVRAEMQALERRTSGRDRAR